MHSGRAPDLDTWPRADLYREFIGMTSAVCDMTVRMDVTALVRLSREAGHSFFVDCLCLTLQALHTVPEFRMG